MRVDIVTIWHNATNRDEMYALLEELCEHEDRTGFAFFAVDNSVENRGFSKGCNYGAAKGDAPLIGFLNPDCRIDGPFLDAIEAAFEDPNVVIAGSSHGKPEREVRLWGLQSWVCGCTMFVRRSWFEEIGGFDEAYVWSFEDTDLCRTAEAAGRRVLTMDDLPIYHASPTQNSTEDAKYKRRHFAEASRVFHNKWRGR